MYLARHTETMLRVVDTFSSPSPVDQKIDVTDTDLLSVADYKIRYKPASGTIPNTMRIQFYGPSKLKGYDFGGNLDHTQYRW